MDNHKYLQWAFNQPLKNPKVILMKLAIMADENGNPLTISIADLNKTVICSRRSIIRWLKTLEDYGLITVNRVRGDVNTYTLNLSVQIITKTSYFQDLRGS